MAKGTTGTRTPQVIVRRLEAFGRDTHDWFDSDETRHLLVIALGKLSDRANRIVRSVFHRTKWNAGNRGHFERLMLRFFEAGLFWKAFNAVFRMLRKDWLAAKRAIKAVCKALAIRAIVKAAWLIVAKLTGITEAVWKKLTALWEAFWEFLRPSPLDLESVAG